MLESLLLGLVGLVLALLCSRHLPLPTTCHATAWT